MGFPFGLLWNVNTWKCPGILDRNKEARFVSGQLSATSPAGLRERISLRCSVGIIVYGPALFWTFSCALQPVVSSASSHLELKTVGWECMSAKIDMYHSILTHPTAGMVCGPVNVALNKFRLNYLFTLNLI